MTVTSTDPLWSVESRPSTERAVVDIPAPAAGFTRLRMTIAYDGSKFRGMAENDGVETVAGTSRA